MVLSNYKGEEIIDTVTIRQGKKHFDKKWIARSVFNDPENKDAFIIGNGESRQSFDLNNLPDDTYGCNALYRDYSPNFLVVIDSPMYQEVIKNGYTEKGIVYTNRSNMVKFQGNSHLIPQNQFLGAGATAMHIAIHDGHKKLICIGFDCEINGLNNNVYKDTNAYRSSTENVDQTVWANQIYKIMLTYPTIQWIFVDCKIPKDIINLDNCSRISYNELYTHINTHNETARQN
jgi:hypothetical protein